MASKQFSFLAEAADQLKFGSAGGPPRGKRRSRKAAAAEISEKISALVSSNSVETKESIRAESTDAPVQRTKAEELEDLFAQQVAVSEANDPNPNLLRIVELMEGWWAWQKQERKWDKIIARDRERKAERAVNVTDSDTGQSGDSSGGSGSGGWGGGGDSRNSSRKRKSRTRRRPGSQPSKWNKFGKWMPKSGKGKALALLAAGVGTYALGSSLFGDSDSVDGSEPLLEKAPELTKEPTNLDTARTAVNVADVALDTAAVAPVAKAAASVEHGATGAGRGLFRGAGRTILGRAGAVTNVALGAMDAYEVSQDETLTDDQKNRAYSGIAGSTAGGAVGSLAGAAIGQVLIPIPIVGAAIGAMAGGALGSWLGESAGEGIYDTVVNRDDAVKTVPTEDGKLEVTFEDPSIKKLADAASDLSKDAGKNTQLTGIASLFASRPYNSVQSGLPGSGLSNYPVGGKPSAWSAMNTGQKPTAQIDYNEEATYIPGQGVLKDLPAHNKQEQRLSNLSGIFEAAGKEYNVDPALVRAITKQESGGKTSAVSHAGAQGLMQLMPATARDLGVSNSFDAEQNVRGGTKYMSQLLKRYNGDTKLALAAYNAGMGNVDKAIKRAGSRDPDAVLAALPQITGARAAETQGYVRNITQFHSEYKAQMQQAQKKVDTLTAERDTQRTQAEGTEQQAPEVKRDASSELQKAQSEVTVGRSDMSDAIVASTTIPTPPPPEPAPKTKKEQKSYAAPASIARQPAIQQSRDSSVTLDDMPLLLSDFGMMHILSSQV